MADGPSDPDKVYYSSPLSRRAALTLGGTGLSTALAGCSEMFGSSSGNPNSSPPESADGTDGEDQGGEEGTSGDVRTTSIGIDETEYQVLPRDEFADALRDGESVEYTVRLYTSPLYGSSRTQLAKSSISVASIEDRFTISYEFPEDTLNQAQQFTFTLEATGPQETAEFDAHTTTEVLLPHYNQALGERRLIVPSAPYPSPGEWDSEFEPVTKTQIWFNEPDESPFNTPDRSELYPEHWYGEYTDLEVTAIVRYPVYSVLENKDHPVYDQMPERQQDLPLFDWAVFNFNIAKIEMIEARRWNSWIIQQIERGRFELNDDGTVATMPSGTQYDAHNDRGGLLDDGSFYSGDVTETPKPFEQYYRSRYGDYRDGGPLAPDNSPIDPLHFAGGRPVLKRWAMEINDSLSNNKNFQAHDAHEYYKATILKALIGSTPYSFSVGSYINTPEEAILNWYQTSSNNASLGANCVSATAFFTGIGVHLFDSTVSIVEMSGNNLAHIQAGLIGLEKPFLPESINDDNADGLISDDDSRYDFQYGRFTPVECIYSGATIGYVQRVDGEYSLRVKTYASQMDINSHIPVNDEYEPDIDGEVLADRDPVQNAFYFRKSVLYPSPRPWFEIVQEE
ncbi:hypothetical protein ACKVMT_12495 [Halobacteriales archaeon Cl-PHB]